MSVDSQWVPSACTLPTVDQPFRLQEFDELFVESLVGVQWEAATRLRLTLAGGASVAARARDLTARESECCSFFTFTVSGDEERVHVEVRVPPGQVAVLDALAARAAGALA